MDMYRILENFDAVNSKKTLVEGQMKRHLEDRAENMSKADFVANAAEYGMKPEEAAEFWIAVNGGDEELDEGSMKDWLHKQADSMSKSDFVAAAGEYGMKPEEAVEFWIAVNGDDEELDEERRSEEDWDAQAIAQQKAKLAREKQKIMMQRKISGQDSGEPPVVRDMSEADMEEGNRFTGNLAKARAAGKKQADLDGDGDMEKVQEVFPGTPEYELRFGKDDASSAFDKKKISTGTVYSRRYKDEPESDDDAPKAAGRPKGTGRKLGAKGPSVASKLLKGKGGLKEHDDIEMVDRGEYDQEGQMARQDLHTMVDAAKELHAILASDENLPEWVQSKITKALDYIDTARDYMKSVDAERGDQPVAEIAPVAVALGRAAVAGAASGAVQSAMGDNEMNEKAPPGAKAERMVKHIKTGYAKDGKLSDKDRAIAYATAWKAKKAGQVEEESSDKKDVPFDGPYRKKGDDKDQFGNKIKHVARHAARQGLADMTTAQLKAELKRRSQVEEESTDTRDQHAEKAGKKVTKDLEYDMKHKGKDDAKAEKAGKKVTKDIEYDDKKDKKKEVEETTVSGSVAPAAGGDAPKKGKGGMQFGKGVYEGQLDELDKSTLGSYVKKAAKDVDSKSRETQQYKDMFAGDFPVRGAKKAVQQKQAAIDKRVGGIGKAVDRLTKEGVYKGQLDELDKSTLGSYVKKATKDVEGKASEKQQYKDMFAGDYPVRGAKKEVQKKQADIDKRVGGIGKAVDRLTKEGVYEGQVAESFEKKLGSILNEGMSVNVSTDDTGKKSISVNATDADADALGDMLKMAGLFSSEGYSRACTDCGGIHEAGACGADMVEEELANSPNEVYTDADYMTQTLSGGLNGPKTTGQTTGPVVNRQASRQGVMAEAERVKEQAESRLWNLYKKI